MDDQWKQRLRERMDARNFTMKSLSNAAGLNDSYVRDMLERGRVPTIDKFAKLANAVGSTVSELLGENASTPTAIESGSIRGEAAIIATLKRIEGLTAQDIAVLHSIIQNDLKVNTASQERNPPRDQSERASSRRVRAP